jgi:hypothetical protein
VGLLVWFAGWVGLLPSDPARPLAPGGEVATDWPVLALTGLAAASLVGWFVARRRLVPQRPPAHPEVLAGHTAALLGLGLVGVLVAIVHPLALVFLVPSLYAWLWLPQLPERHWWRSMLFVAGLVGMALPVLSIGVRLHLGARTPLYVVQLVSVGYLSWTSVVIALMWLGVTAQMATLVVGRYGPYAGGAEVPPRGVIRELVRRLALAGQSRRR